MKALKPVLSKRIIRQGKRVGMLMVFKEHNIIRIGYSLCTKGDYYSHEMANKICYSRAFSLSGYEIPCSIQTEYDIFVDRCKRFFKEDYL